MQITGPTYKWRIDNLTYVYITNNDGTEPFIKTDTENFIEDIIKAWVKTWDYGTYEVEFNKMVSLVHEYENGKYRNVIFYDPSVYFNECEDCTDYSGIVIPTDIEITASTVTHTVPYYENPSIEIHDGGVIQEGMQKVRKFGMESWIKDAIPGLTVIGEITPQLSLENFRASIESLVEDEYVDVNMGFFVNEDSNSNYYPANAKRGNLYCFKKRASVKNANELFASVYYVTNLVGPSGAVLPFTYNSTHESYSFGEECEINGDYAVSMGYYNESTGENSLTHGQENVASGKNSHAEGYYNTAEGECSYVNGIGNIAKNTAQTVIGQYATVDNGDAIFQIGIGTGEGDRRDALKITKDGTFIFTGDKVQQQQQRQQGTATYNMRRSAPSVVPVEQYQSVSVTTTDMENLVNMTNIINGKFSEYDDYINERLSGLTSEWNNLILTKNEEARNGLIDTVIKDLQEQIDGEINSWFLPGPPSLTTEPACDWLIKTKDSNGNYTNVIDWVETEKEYSRHIGDTYTDMSDYNPTDSLIWEQGILNWNTGEEQESHAFIRTNFIETVEHLYIKNPDTTNYTLCAFYFDENKNLVKIDTILGILSAIKTEYKYVRLRLQHPQKSDSTYESIKPEDASKLNLTQFNPTSGMSWRFCKGKYTDENGTCKDGWHWHMISDSAAIEALLKAGQAQFTADGKACVFMSVDKEGDRVPNNYNVGDMWILNDIALKYGKFPSERGYKVGDLLNANSGSSEYVEEHWSKEIRYTDDSMAIEAMNKANEAVIAAENAHNEAIDSLRQLEEVHKDGYVYIDEFKTLKNELNEIKAECTKLVGDDGKGGEAAQWVLVDSYDNVLGNGENVQNISAEYFQSAKLAIAALTWYTNEEHLERVNGVVKDYIIINYSTTGTEKPLWRDIENYYPKRQTLMNQIARAAKEYSENIKTTAETAAENAFEAMEMADRAEKQSEYALSQLDAIDNDWLVAKTEFASLDSQLQDILQDLNTITAECKEYENTQVYEKYELGKLLNEFTTHYNNAVRALKYYSNQKTNEGIKATDITNGVDSNGNIYIRTSDKNKTSSISKPLGNTTYTVNVSSGNVTINIDYENIEKYYVARNNILKTLFTTAQEYVRSMENLTPEAVANMLNNSKKYGVNKILRSRCDFKMTQWGSTTALTQNIVSKSHTETTIKADSKLSFCTLLLYQTNGTDSDIDKLTDKMWKDEYVSVSIDVFAEKSKIKEYAQGEGAGKLTLGIQFRYGDKPLFTKQQVNILDFDVWCRLKLTFKMEQNVTDYVTIGSNVYSADKVYLYVAGEDIFKNGSTFKFRNMQLEYSTEATPWCPAPEDSDEAYSLADDAKQNAEIAAKDAADSLAYMADFSNDGKVTPAEKPNIKREWDEVKNEFKQCESYSETLWDDAGSTKPKEWMDLNNAYTGLTNYIENHLFLDKINPGQGEKIDAHPYTITLSSVTKTTVSNLESLGNTTATNITGRELYDRRFTDYYKMYTIFMNKVSERIAELETGKVYDKLTGRNYFAKKFIRQYWVSGIEKSGSDSDGLYFALRPDPIYRLNLDSETFGNDKRHIKDTLDGAIKFKPNTQYRLKVKWKARPIDSDAAEGMYIGFLYKSGESATNESGQIVERLWFNGNYVICKKTDTSVVEKEIVSSLGSDKQPLTICGVGVTYGGNMLCNLYEIQITEGDKVYDTWIQAEEDKNSVIDQVITEGTTETNGGLIASSLLFLKDIKGDINTGLSGINDFEDTGGNGIAMWAGGSYEDAVDTAKKVSNSVPVLITKTGVGTTLGPLSIEDCESIQLLSKDNKKRCVMLADSDNDVILKLQEKRIYQVYSSSVGYVDRESEDFCDNIIIQSGPLPDKTSKTVEKDCTCTTQKVFSNQKGSVLNKLKVGSITLPNYNGYTWIIDNDISGLQFNLWISAGFGARTGARVKSATFHIGSKTISISQADMQGLTGSLSYTFNFWVPIDSSTIKKWTFTSGTYDIYVSDVVFDFNAAYSDETLSTNKRYDGCATVKVKLNKNFKFKCVYEESDDTLKEKIFIGNNGIRIYGSSSKQYFEVSTKGSKLKCSFFGLPQNSGSTTTTGELYVDNGVLKIRT